MQTKILQSSGDRSWWPKYQDEAIEAIAFFLSDSRGIEATGEMSEIIPLISIDGVTMMGAQLSGMWYLIPLKDSDRRNTKRLGPYADAADALLHLKLMGTMEDSL